MQGLMMEIPLLITSVMRHCERNHTKREVVSVTADHLRHRYTYGDCFERTRRLANALDRIGATEDARIATLAWNLAKWMALLLPEQGRWKEKHTEEKNAVLAMNFGTFVRAFMLIPTQVVRCARQVKLRLLSWNRWQHVFFRALDSVRLIS